MPSISRDSGVSGKQGRDAYLDALALDTRIPSMPVAIPVGMPVGLDLYPTNQLLFETLDYRGTYAFAAWKWRIAEVTLKHELPLVPGERPKFEIESVWESEEISDKDQRAMTIGSHLVRVDARYRVRVCAKDMTGRWSHWSSPVQFMTSEPDTASILLADLKLTELMYNAPAGSDFDFVELFNANDTSPLDLGGVTFSEGINYTFPAGTEIGPLGYLVRVKTADFSAFRGRYTLDSQVLLAGPYTQNLANGGEQVRLQTSRGGTDIVSFAYQAGQGWPSNADGSGHSLIPLVLDSQAGGALNDGANWRASAKRNGSPGRSD